MKYSVSSYSYMKMIRAGEITPFEVIAKLDLYMAYKGFGAFYKD